MYVTDKALDDLPKGEAEGSETHFTHFGSSLLGVKASKFTPDVRDRRRSKIIDNLLHTNGTITRAEPWAHTTTFLSRARKLSVKHVFGNHECRGSNQSIIFQHLTADLDYLLIKLVQDFILTIP